MAAHPVFRAGSTALVTGAASGVGLAVAKLCAKHSMKIALVDRKPELLKEVQSSVFKDDVNAKIYPTDVSKIEQWKDLRAKVEMDLGQVSFLALNAGIMKKGGWEDNEYFHEVSPSSLRTLSCQRRSHAEVYLAGAYCGLTSRRSWIRICSGWSTASTPSCRP